MTYDCYTRWENNNLICICKVGNPACDRYKNCETLPFELKQYDDIKGCMNNRKYKRTKGGAVKQV